MRITADHAFHIGSQHLRSGMPCQDYAVSRSSGYGTCVAVSDGCSSGGKTDVGARIVALNSVASVLNEWNFDEDDVDADCDEKDSIAMDRLGLCQSDMLATRIYALVSKGGLANSRFARPNGVLHVKGDGVVASISREGRLVMVRLDWDQNMPFYPAYKGPQSKQQFIDAQSGDLTRSVASIHWHRSGGGEDSSETLERVSLEKAMGGFTYRTAADDTFLAAFSDGVTQVDGMDWRDVVAELLSFKSTEGDFVKRRMNRFLKDCLAHGKGPVDDISMACIHIDHEAE